MSLFNEASLVVTPNGYKADKLYSIKPTSGAGDLDFVRNTAATRVNESGLIETVAANVPRLDYTGGGCPSLLLEPQRTNLVTFSEQFDNAAWESFRSSVTANATASPDGSTNAEKLIQQSGANDAGGVYQTLTVSNATVYTYSFFAKEAGYNFCFARMSNSPSDFYAWFNLSTGVVGSLSVGTTSSSIVSYGNGWYRCSMTFTSAGTTAIPHIYIANSDGSDQTPSADGVKGIFAYGCQLEAGAYATSYIPTLETSVTRVADAASKTGISSLIGQTEGTIFFECSNKALLTNSRYFGVSDGTASNRIDIYQVSANELGIFVGVSGVAQVNVQNVALPASGAFKFALAYANNNYVWYLNGVQIGTNTSASVPATSVAVLGVSPDLTANAGNSPFKQALLFKTPLTNDQLAELTA